MGGKSFAHRRPDAIPFDSSITFGIEHSGINEAQADYASTACWYGQGTYQGNCG